MLFSIWHFGFGTFEKKTKIRNIAHNFFQFLIYGIKVFQMDEYKKIKIFLDKFQRQIDIDVIKHLYVFNHLKKNIKAPKSIAVIGDGKANFITNAYLNYPKSVLYSINLPEVLIHDYFILKKYGIYKEADISVVENEHDLSDESKKVFFITPNNINMLLNLKIELFVNICSFQEIKNKDIAKYFDLILVFIFYFSLIISLNCKPENDNFKKNFRKRESFKILDLILK